MMLASAKPITVTSGSSEFGSTWRVATTDSESPLARAVRTKSSVCTSSAVMRTRRATPPKPPIDIASTGR